MRYFNLSSKFLVIITIIIVTLISFHDTGAGQNAISLNKKGWVSLNKGDYFGAIFTFKNALNRNPRYKRAVIGLGTAFYEVEAYEQSYDMFRKALIIDNDSSDAHIGMGFSMIGMGDYSEALKHFKDAVKLSESKIKAHYGIAYLYTVMGKRIWAKRKLNTIFRINPFHYESLLLMSEIKSSENRLSNAKEYVEKAIEINSESPKGYTKLGEILFRDYLKTENQDSLAEAIDALKNALSIQPKSFHANRALGNIELIQKNYDKAIDYFNGAKKDFSGSSAYYSLGIAYDRNDNRKEALNSYLEALKRSAIDSILRGKLEDYLVFRDYKIGHPVRVMLNKENVNRAEIKSKRNLHNQVVMYLRRALLMNPMDKETREQLMEYYYVNDYYRLYIDEIKELQRSFDDPRYRNKLTVAITKRRDRLYHREGFSNALPPRDVPVVFVINFDSGGMMTEHPDAGEVIASNLTFTLGQFGRMVPVGIRKRLSLNCGFKCGGDNLYRSVQKIEELSKSGEIKKVDYIVYGSYREKGNTIAISIKLLDNKKGFIIGEFNLSESGKEALPRLSLRSARKIFGMIPYTGRVLKLKDKGIIVNLGLFDGISKGESFVVYKFIHSPQKGYKVKRKIIFKVAQADTYVSYAKIQRVNDLDILDTQDIVYPLKKRRAKAIQ